MPNEILSEAYERLHRTGPEFGAGTWLANHGPMAVEVLVRRGRADDVPRWLDTYVRRLEDLPTARSEINDRTWAEALGDPRRIGDWIAYFGRQVVERPWREVLAAWWPRLLPGILAGATHGVIRVGHAARTLAHDAVLHTLPALPRDLWIPSLSAAWTASAAITAGYAPERPAPRSALREAPSDADPVVRILDEAAADGDEHVIKFADTAADVYERTGNRDALAAAVHAARLIGGGS